MKVPSNCAGEADRVQGLTPPENAPMLQGGKGGRVTSPGASVEGFRRALAPPLGLRPRWSWDSERAEEIEAAMERYATAEKDTPACWAEELAEIRERTFA